ncbi:hypothetical protein ABW19_dt0202297 [Dactylella cylindrospora]|nr:hypothetical protein ABW19_dt0202297 [Dactylella cylindrospora]
MSDQPNLDWEDVYTHIPDDEETTSSVYTSQETLQSIGEDYRYELVKSIIMRKPDDPDPDLSKANNYEIQLGEYDLDKDLCQSNWELHQELVLRPRYHQKNPKNPQDENQTPPSYTALLVFNVIEAPTIGCPYYFAFSSTGETMIIRAAYKRRDLNWYSKGKYSPVHYSSMLIGCLKLAYYKSPQLLKNLKYIHHDDVINVLSIVMMQEVARMVGVDYTTGETVTVRRGALRTSEEGKGFSILLATPNIKGVERGLVGYREAMGGKVVGRISFKCLVGQRSPEEDLWGILIELEDFPKR